MTALSWIVAGGLGMILIALAGGLALAAAQRHTSALMLPAIALSAGSLLGGAFLHMLPTALAVMPDMRALGWTLAGFCLFFLGENLLRWRHEHDAEPNAPQPVTNMILVGDGLHNLIGGVAVAGAFVHDIRLGITVWFAAALHEVPQEIGDYAVLVHGGFSRRRALILNAISASTFLLGGLAA